MKQIAERIGQWIIGILHFFYPPFKRFLSEETFRYAATGGMNLVLDILLYFIFYNFIIQGRVVEFGFFAVSPHIAAFLFVFPITFSIGFLLAKFVTFIDSQIKGTKQLWRYAISVGGSIALNYILLKLFVEHFGMLPTLAKIITTFIVVAYSFIIQKFFTFKTGKKQLERV